MKTACNNAAEFYTKLTQLGFVPGKFDGRDGDRSLEKKNGDGHLDVRIVVSYEGETTPHAITLIKFDGRRSQVTQWQSRLSAYMPLQAVLTMIKAV